VPTNSIDFILTDPPYLVNYRDRNGRSIQNDVQTDWLRPAMREAYRVLKHGLGMFVGSWFSGFVVEHYTLAVAEDAITYDWRSVWFFSAVVFAVVLIVFCSRSPKTRRVRMFLLPRNLPSIHYLNSDLWVLDGGQNRDIIVSKA